LPEVLIGLVSKYLAIRYVRGAEDFYYTVNSYWQTKGAVDVLNIQNVQHFGILHTLRRLTGCKTVLTFHGYLTFEAESEKLCEVGDPTQQWLWHLEKNGYDKFDSIVCVARSAVNYISQFTKTPIHIVPNGIDTDLFRPRPKATTPSAPITILFAGHLQEAKGILDALRIMLDLVRESRLNVILKVAGGGILAQKSQEFVVENGLTDNVYFYGVICKEKMASFYQSGDILLFPSKKAGFSGKSEESSPYSVLEAMACGLSVVAYKTGGLQEHIIHGVTGFLAEPDDYNGLSALIKELVLSEELLKRMGSASRKHCVQNFSNILMAQRYLDIYAQQKVSGK